MSVETREIEEWAKRLWDAETDRKPIDPLTDQRDWDDRDDAYRIQLELVNLRQADGHVVVGKKIGMTSKAMQEMAGIDEPDYGHLFDVMRVPSGGTISSDDLIQPKVEPEIAFVLDRALEGPATSPAEVLAATAFICPSLEVVDSRVADWKIRWVDTIADNGSSSRFVLSDDGFDPRGVDLRTLGVVLERNGEIQATATMAAVLGNPLRAISWLVPKLERFGIALGAGDVILPGSPCRAADAARGDHFEATFTGMGSVRVTFN